MSQEQKQIIQYPKIVTVKNARFFYDNKHSAYRIIHYNHEILTVKIIESRSGFTEDKLEIINIFPVSESSKNAIYEALRYLGIKESIEQICDNLDIDLRELSIGFWGFDPFKRFDYRHTPVDEWKYRPSTTKTSMNDSYRRKKDFWLEWENKLLNSDLPNPRSNKKYYLLEGFDGNDVTFKKVVKSASYDKLEKHIKQIFNSCHIRKFENIGSDPDGYISYNRNGETRLAITIYNMEFKDQEDKESELKYYRDYYNGVITL